MKGITMAALAAASMIILSGCEMPLPEKDTKEALLYAEKCGICHTPKHPAALSSNEWEGIFPVMEQRVKETVVRAALTPEEKDTILGYLKKHSRRRGI